MTDRLTDSELQQIANHRQSCDCDLCTRHRLLAMAELQFGQEFEARLDALQAQPRVLMLAGSLRDADTFVRQHQRQYPDVIFRYPRASDDLRGLRPDSTTLVRVGTWQDSPLVRGFASALDDFFPDWRNSPEYLWDNHQNVWVWVPRSSPHPRRGEIQIEIQIDPATVSALQQWQMEVQEFRVLRSKLPTDGRTESSHSCVTCCYLLRGNPDICNAFHTPGNLYAANECADWEQR